MNQMCLITLGRIVTSARKSRGLSQRETAALMVAKGVKIDHVLISKIENDRVDICDRSYDLFIQCFCELFKADIDWIEQIRQQTQVVPRLTNAIFPVDFKQLM